MEVCNIIHEAVIKAILKRKKYKKATWYSKEALQMAEKRREEGGSCLGTHVRIKDFKI